MKKAKKEKKEKNGMGNPVSNRRIKAYERAEDVCREVRRQLAGAGGCYDNLALHKLMMKWMRLAGNRSYYPPRERNSSNYNGKEM